MFQKHLLEVWLTFNQIVQHLKVAFVMVDLGIESDLPCCAVTRVIEQCHFNSTLDPFNGETANFISKPSKVIESKT